MATAAEPGTLILEEPGTIRCGESTYFCGGISYRAIKHVATTAKQATTVRSLAVAVWGKSVGPEVSRTTVKGVLHRVNDILTGIGARERMTLDGEAILLI